MPKDMPLSGRQIDLDLQASKRSLQTGRGKFPMRKNTDKAKRKLLFNEYIMQNFTQASKENISEYPDSDEKNRDLLITRLNILFRENLLIKKIWKVSLQKYFS